MKKLKDKETTGIGRRIKQGESDKIDRINELIRRLKKNENDSDSLYELWSLYELMIHKLIQKWRKFYADEDSHIFEYCDIYQESFLWFRKYTIEKFEQSDESEIGKRATFGVFIRSHMDSRIRFIYQKEIKRVNKEVLVNDSNNSYDEYDGVINPNVMLEDAMVESAESTYFERINKAERILIARKIDTYLQLTSKDANRYVELILRDIDLCEKIKNQGFDLECFLDLLTDDDKLIKLYEYLKGAEND